MAEEEKKDRKETMQMPQVLALIFQNCLLLGKFEESKKVYTLNTEIQGKTDELFNIAKDVVPEGFSVDLTRMYIRWGDKTDKTSTRKVIPKVDIQEVCKAGETLKQKVGKDGYTEEMYREDIVSLTKTGKPVDRSKKPEETPKS